MSIPTLSEVMEYAPFDTGDEIAEALGRLRATFSARSVQSDPRDFFSVDVTPETFDVVVVNGTHPVAFEDEFSSPDKVAALLLQEFPSR